MGEQTHHHVIIIGAGFAGLGMAIRLQQHETTDFVVLERAADVGGTWRDNSYPGCACDVPSALYSFSFELNPFWTHSFSGQREIWDYLRRCTQRYGLTPHIRFRHEVLAASWEHARRCWQVSTNRGELTCDVLITATGPLSEPRIPDLPGLETFQGKVFHSARWDQHYDLRDRRVAVVGTGASAVQFIPKIQPTVGSLTLFQRTPPGSCRAASDALVMSSSGCTGRYLACTGWCAPASTAVGSRWCPDSRSTPGCSSSLK